METLEQTVAALGKLVSMLTLGAREKAGLVVARWKHGDARIPIESADALHVLSLGGTQNVCHARTDRIARSTSRAGDVGILPSDVSSTTVIEGEADILQVFIKPKALGAFPDAQFTREPLVTSAREDLRASAVRLFVAANRDLETGSEHAASALMATVRGLLPSGSAAGEQLHKGGLPPNVMCRLDRMISARTGTPDISALRIQERADEARLSVNHLIRAFRQTTGTTPHQYIMAHRRQRVLELLGDSRLPIGDLAYTLGFSSAAHFAAAFRQCFGVRPGEYRFAVLIF